MHRIKAQAKRSAWYGDVDASGLHNPFARYRPARRPTTLSESGQSEGVGAGRSHRHSTESTHDLPGPGPLRHAATDPGNGAPFNRRASDDNIRSSRFSSPAPSLSKETAGEKVSQLLHSQTENHSAETSAKLKPRFTIASQIRVVFLGAWLNVLLVFIPIGFGVNYAHLGSRTVFAVNFVAIIPSTMMISLAVDELSLRTGEVIGALLNMTFSNATQLISSILLLKSRQIIVLKTSLLGSIISNLLLMLGICFFAGGINRMEQYFNVTVAQMVSGMLFLAIISLVVPTASRLLGQGVTDHGVVIQSRGTSIVILISYGLYLLFQLKTHAAVFSEPSQKVMKREIFKSKDGVARSVQVHPVEEEEEIDEEEEPQLAISTAIAVLLAFTILIGFNAEFATSSIQSMVQKANISQTFVGFVILPILSNDVSSIVVAVKDKLDLSISLTLERCMQTSLLVVPLVVIVAWGMSVEEMSLDFDGFSVAVTFASIIIVTYVIQDGKSNWLTGALLIKVYVIVALAAYFVES